MSTSTYLDVTNMVLVELNEVPLTSSTFANAVGIQKFIKDSVKRSLYDINTEHYKWPFLAASTSTEPHLGNAVVSSAEGVRWYLIKTGSTGIDDDYQFIDWENFTLSEEGVVGETAPYEVDKLIPISLADWSKRFSESEAEDKANTRGYGKPKRVIRNPDGRYFGLSPIPDKEYKIYFFAWNQLSNISVYNDAFPFQEQWVYSVLVPRMRYYAWMFKENSRQSDMAENDWKKGIRRMREQLIEDKAKKHFRDDRIRYP